MSDRETIARGNRASPGSGSFQTALSPSECQERLLAALERDHDGAHIYGSVTPEIFELHRGTSVRTGAHPVLKGSFTPGPEGTRIDYRASRSKSRFPIFKIAAVVWAFMALSWVVFFIYWIVDRDGIGIGLPRLLLLLGIVAIMGITIAAGRRSDERGAAELLEIVQGALAATEQSPDDTAREDQPQLASDVASNNRVDQ